MEENKEIFCIESWGDYEGGGIESIWSTLEKALAAFNSIKPNSGQNIVIVKKKIDDNTFHEELNYYKHG